MSNVSPISGASRSATVTSNDRAVARRDLASSSRGVSETANGERNASATAAEARRLASSSSQGSNVGAALDIRG